MKLNKYGDKSKKGKLIALIVKAVTGTLGASVLMAGYPAWITLTILVIGAVVNEILNFYNWNK